MKRYSLLVALFLCIAAFAEPISPTFRTLVQAGRDAEISTSHGGFALSEKGQIVLYDSQGQPQLSVPGKEGRLSPDGCFLLFREETRSVLMSLPEQRREFVTDKSLVAHGFSGNREFYLLDLDMNLLIFDMDSQKWRTAKLALEPQDGPYFFDFASQIGDETWVNIANGGGFSKLFKFGSLGMTEEPWERRSLNASLDSFYFLEQFLIPPGDGSYTIRSSGDKQVVKQVLQPLALGDLAHWNGRLAFCTTEGEGYRLYLGTQQYGLGFDEVKALWFLGDAGLAVASRDSQKLTVKLLLEKGATKSEGL